MNPCPRGANTNWPNEPATVARPMAQERRSSETSLPRAAITTVNDPPASPRPTSTPEVNCIASGVSLNAMSPTPSA
jgi:hypothetical protein